MVATRTGGSPIISARLLRNPGRTEGVGLVEATLQLYGQPELRRRAGGLGRSPGR